MRLRYVTLLLILLVIIGSARSSDHSQHNTSDRPLRLHKRAVPAATADRLLHAEVPDRFKKWSIFQDGNRIREGIRKGYSNLLGVVDKLHRPYPFSKGIEKKWMYMPDLRKHYVLPRVLRVPLILQDGPVRHNKPFTTYIKNADEELGMSDTAKKHLPELAEEEKAAPNVASTASEDPVLSMRRGRHNSFNRRRRSRSRLQENGAIEPHSDWQENEASRRLKHSTPFSEIQPASPSANSEVDPSRLAPFSNNVDQGLAAQQPSSEAHSASGKSSSTRKLDIALIEMTEKFEAFKRFKEQQMRKASVRYVSHPEFKPLPPKQEEAPPVKEPGTNLAPIKTKPRLPQPVTPEDTPRTTIDTAGADADVSNANTPMDSSIFYPPGKTPFGYNFRNSPEATTPIDVPFSHSSTPGYMSPGGFVSSGSSPRGPIPPGFGPEIPLPSQGYVSGGETPGRAKSGPPTPESPAPETPIRIDPQVGFRFPANYADLLHSRRLKRAGKEVQRMVSKPTFVTSNTIQTPSRESIMEWDAGPPSPEGLRAMQEAADLNEVDHAVYGHDAAGHESPVASPFKKVHPLADQDQAAEMLPSSSKREPSTDHEADQAVQPAPNVPGEIVKDRVQPDKQGTEAMPSLSSHSHNFDAETKDASSPNRPDYEVDPTSLPDHQVDVEGNDASLPDHGFSSQRSSPDRSVEAAQRDEEDSKLKTNRPASLKMSFQRVSSFLFPTPRQSPISPGLEGFKPSLKEGTSDSPEMGRSGSKGQSFKWTMLGLRDKLKYISTKDSPETTIEAFKDQH
ncbi:hypothetical protein, partial [Sporisorium scitamineum]